MTDPYQHQYGQPPAAPPTWPQQPAYQVPPPPKPRKRRGLTITLSVIFAVLLLCVGGAVIYGVTKGGAPKDPATTDLPSSPAANPSEARPGVDAGAGTPGALCSTDRLGKFFVKDGVTYTCKGPKPYRWLP